MHDYNSLNIWRQQAHTRVDEGDGDKLADLNEQKDLVPYEQPSVFSAIFGRTVERHTAPLKASCEQLAKEAQLLGERVGIRERIAAKPDDKDWDELTIGELAESLDRLLIAPQVLLVKVRGTFDDVCDTCRQYFMTQKTKHARDQAIQSFEQKLEEVFQQLNEHTHDPQVSLDRIKQSPENDAIHTLIKLGVDLDHPDSREALALANQIDGIFRQFIQKHQQDILQRRHPIPQDQSPSPNSERELQLRFKEMLTDLNDDSKLGSELNGRIRELAKDTKTFVENAQNPVQALKMIKGCCLQGMHEVEVKEPVLKYSTQPMREALAELEKNVTVTMAAQQKFSSKKTKASTATSLTPEFRVSPALQNIMGRISSYSTGLTEDQSSAYCQLVWRDIHDYLVASQARLDYPREEIATLKLFVFQQISQAAKGFLENNIHDEILIPLLRHIDSIPQQPARPTNIGTSSPARSQASAISNPAPKTPGYGVIHNQPPPQVTDVQLWQKGLITNETEYKELERMIPAQRLSHPDIIPALGAFRKLQKFNPGISNQHFAIMIQYWSPEEMNTWFTEVEKASRAQNPDREMMWPASQAIELLAWANNASPELLGVVTHLDMNALATPYLLRQLRTLAMCETQLREKVQLLDVEDIVYLLNMNLLVPLHMGRMFKNHMNPKELIQQYEGLSREINAAKTDSFRRLKAYNNSQTNKFLSAKRLRIHQVPPNGDCFYSAIGHLFGEPMRKVRQKCDWAARDILAMNNGTYRFDKTTPYARRINEATKHIDLKRLQRQVEKKSLLTPAFERTGDKNQAWGEEDDLALVATTYGTPVVPLSHLNGFNPLCGYGVNGNRYETWDFSNPSIMEELVTAEQQQPILLIATQDHWDPLVPNR